MAQFEGQQEGEEILFLFRRHIIAMRKGFYLLLIPFLIASLPMLIVPFITAPLPAWLTDPFNLLYVALGGLFIGCLLFFYHWMGWYFSVFIVTNVRLRQITQTGFFGKSVIDLGLSKIQNISYNVEGFNAAVFGFGTIVIQTYVGDLILDKIHNPGKIYNKIHEAVRESTSNTVVE